MINNEAEKYGLFSNFSHFIVTVCIAGKEKHTIITVSTCSYN